MPFISREKERSERSSRQSVASPIYRWAVPYEAKISLFFTWISERTSRQVMLFKELSLAIQKRVRCSSMPSAGDFAEIASRVFCEILFASTSGPKRTIITVTAAKNSKNERYMSLRIWTTLNAYIT